MGSRVRVRPASLRQFSEVGLCTDRLVVAAGNLKGNSWLGDRLLALARGTSRGILDGRSLAWRCPSFSGTRILGRLEAPFRSVSVRSLEDWRQSIVRWASGNLDGSSRSSVL